LIEESVVHQQVEGFLLEVDTLIQQNVLKPKYEEDNNILEAAWA
jgi:hypothetical protein